MPLDDSEIDRYQRHILLPEIGGAGQQKLKAARVALVGIGGLGNPAAQYLAAAGVGTLGLIDDDQVSLSNLQRQVLFTDKDVGRAKTAAAAAALTALNPHVTIETHAVRLDAGNAASVLDGYHLVLDGCDNFVTRFAVAAACAAAQIPLISGAVGRFDGQLATFKPWLTDAGGERLPSYRSLVPDLPEDEDNCATTGIVGALTGIVGSLMALEAIKEITGAGDSLAGRLLLYDGLSGSARTVQLPRDPADPL